LSLLRALRRHWPYIAVVLQLVLIAVLSGWLAADLIFPGGASLVD
jgi:hypothetical protein